MQMKHLIILTRLHYARGNADCELLQEELEFNVRYGAQLLQRHGGSPAMCCLGFAAPQLANINLEEIKGEGEPCNCSAWANYERRTGPQFIFQYDTAYGRIKESTKLANRLMGLNDGGAEEKIYPEDAAWSRITYGLNYWERMRILRKYAARNGIKVTFVIPSREKHWAIPRHFLPEGTKTECQITEEPFAHQSKNP